MDYICQVLSYVKRQTDIQNGHSIYIRFYNNNNNNDNNNNNNNNNNTQSRLIRTYDQMRVFFVCMFVCLFVCLFTCLFSALFLCLELLNLINLFNMT